MNLFKIKTLIMFGICIAMILMGSYMVYEGMLHQVEGDTESHVEVSILHLGHVTGNQRIGIMAFGMLLIFMAMKFLWKIDLRAIMKRGHRWNEITHRITDTGKRIAERIKGNREN